MDGGTIVLIVVGVILLILVIWFIATSNKLNRSVVKIEEASSGIDVALTKRYDVLVKMMDVVKAYAKHEEETLTKVMEARYAAMNSSTVEQRIDNENILQGALKSLFAVSENYPQLQANTNFMDLQNTLKNLENEIASSRKYYNGVVKMYNTYRESFPSNIIAGIFRFEKRALFEVDAPEERKNVKVSFE